MRLNEGDRVVGIAAFQAGLFGARLWIARKIRELRSPVREAGGAA
jgi:hypothetical protein